MSEKIKILNFSLLDVQMCIDIKHVTKVLPIMELESVPASPRYVAGLMNLAGKSIPVIDLAILLGMKRLKEYSLDTPILLSKNGKDEIAIVVDQIKGLVENDQSDLQMRDDMDKATSPYTGALNINGQLSLLLDINKIFKFCLSPNQSELSMNMGMYQNE